MDGGTFAGCDLMRAGERRRLRLSAGNARSALLSAQGLNRRPRARATKAAVLETIRRMGALQIDTIHVVARSPYLVLWSRLGDYDPVWLDELLAEGRLFEYWSHEACFVPIEDYPLYRHRMLNPGDGMGWKYSHDWMDRNRTLVERIREEVRQRGPVRSSDFERRDGKGGGWWGWKPEKRALEMLFTSGEIMVARRERFQRVYDLQERVLPGWDDFRLPSTEEALRALALKAVLALGVATIRWVADYFRTPRERTAAALAALAAEGMLVEVEVDGWRDSAYVHHTQLEQVERAREGPSLTTVLSPFDPLVWDRGRARSLFGFDYSLECYTPAARRRYGYFVLPVLRRGKLVARLDAKAHRSAGQFEIKAFFLEEDVRPSASLLSDVGRALAQVAAWHDTPEVIVKRTVPAGLLRALQRAAGGGSA